MNGQCPLAQCGLRPFGRERTAAESDDRVVAGEHVSRNAFLDAAEGRLAVLEQLRDRRPARTFDLVVEVDERPANALRDRTAERRLAGAHEADERELPAFYRGAQSILSR